ncbi:unnamed protein product [Cochlearia groenlandica]
MQEIMSIIFQGLKLVNELESKLPEKSPESLSTSLVEISKTFCKANEMLKMFIEMRNSEKVLMNQHNSLITSCSDMMMHEYWLKSGGSTSSQRMIEIGDGGGGKDLTAERSGGRSSSTMPRQRKRKNQDEEETVLVAALRTGNTDMPPDDNHTWRKYGQKEILGSTFPRAYYRCTHQKLYNCPAKKQVQRLNEDPFTFRVTYRGSHTCHIYSTAPTASTTASTAVNTLGHSLDYDPIVYDMTNSMFGNSGIGANMDFIFPFNDQTQNYQRFKRLDGSDEFK